MSAYTPSQLGNLAVLEASAFCREAGLRLVSRSVLWLLDVSNQGASLEVSFSATDRLELGTSTYQRRIAL